MKRACVHDITPSLGWVFHHTSGEALNGQSVQQLLRGEGGGSGLCDCFGHWPEEVGREKVNGDLQLSDSLGPGLVRVFPVKFC